MKGMRFVFMLLCLLAVNTVAIAGPGKWSEQAIPVERENGVNCTLDATTIKSTQCPQGTIFTEVWVKYALDEQARHRLEVLSDGQPPTVKYEELETVAVHYLFCLQPAATDKPPVKFEVEKRYESADGKLLDTTGEQIPNEQSKWYSLDKLEQKVVLRLLTEPAFYQVVPLAIKLTKPAVDLGCAGGCCRLSGNSEAANNRFVGEYADGEGVLGLAWGTKLTDCKSITPSGSVNLGDYQIVYTYDGLGAFKNTVTSRTPLLLCFTREQGLVMTSWQFAASRPSPVETALQNYLGEPSNRGGTLTWRRGDTTRIVLDKLRNGDVQALTISSEAFWQTDKTLSRYL